MIPPATASSRIRIGTRGSALALAQAQRVGDLLVAAHPGLAVEIIAIDTQGDRDKSSSLTVIGGAGVFTSAVQDELLAGNVDIAVHSAKDLPARSPEGLVIAAVPEREDPRDVLVSRHGVGMASLPAAPVIGTSSRRRAMEVLSARPDARISDLRGNVDTRLRKSESSDYDAIVIAAAGLSRLGLLDRVAEWLPIERFIPAPSQGALAVEARADDAAALAAVTAIDDPAASAAVRAERAFLGAMGAGCTVPLGAHVRREDGAWVLRAVYGASDAEAVWLVRELDPARLADEACKAAEELLRRHGLWQSAPRVMVTRSERQAAPLADALSEAGFAPMVYPVIRIAPPAITADIDNRLLGVAHGAFDWVVFTSANAVDTVVTRMAALRLGPDAFAGVRVAAVGKATARAIARAGLPEPLMANEATGAALADEVARRLEGRKRVFLPRGDLARDEVEVLLEAAGADVTAVIAYQTLPEHRPHPLDAAVLRGQADVVTFMSPSSIGGLSLRLGGLAPIDQARIVCVGPVTASEAEARGLTVHAVAEDATVAGVVAAVQAALSRIPTGSVAGSSASGAGPKERS